MGPFKKGNMDTNLFDNKLIFVASIILIILKPCCSVNSLPSNETKAVNVPNSTVAFHDKDIKSNVSFEKNITTTKSTPVDTSNGTFSSKSEHRSPVFVMLYTLICIYSFLGIAVTCHHYFVPSLSRICEDYKMSEDIVGATFMAAGSSAPELATVIIAVFLTDNDIGISDVIGSAVFNMLFVTALCGLITTKPLRLNWWPVIRNCFFYTLSILLLLVAIANEEVSWVESLLLIVGYIAYWVALYFNEFLEAFANTLPLPFNKIPNDDVTDLDENYIQLEDRKISSASERYSIVQSNGRIINSIQQTYQSNEPAEPVGLVTEENRFKLPPNATALEQLKFYCIYPVYVICKITIPDWQSSRFQNYYLLTFFVSFIWISLYSYIMVLMIIIIGEILRIPSTVMGLTFVAAGVSVPDAITSLKVVKQGYGDMAVSNAIGSNIFDIMICLGVPWFLKTAVIKPGSYVKVYSIGMIHTTVSLFSTVILLLITIQKNGWKLDKKFGVMMMIGYFIFITMATLNELISAGDGC